MHLEIPLLVVSSDYLEGVPFGILLADGSSSVKDPGRVVQPLEENNSIIVGGHYTVVQDLTNF